MARRVEQLIGKPLSFLEHHIQCGNSLLGTTPALLAKGIPDEAFEPIEGDDKKVCSGLKRQNKDERRGQEGLFDEIEERRQLGDLTAAMAKLEGLPDDTVESIREKERRYADLVRSDDAYRTSGRFLADAWCAAFVWKKVKDDNLLPMTHARFRRIEMNPHDIVPQEFAEVRRLAGQYQFFHWLLAFPAVFRYPAKGEAPDNELTGWCGGFDAVLGNPPWERIKLQEQEWFAAHGRPDIAGARTASIRGKLIRELETKDAALYRAFLDDRRKAEGESHLVRDSSGIDEDSNERRGLFPLCGRGDVNTYSLFAELNRNLLRPTGRVGCIVPSGIATTDTTKLFFEDLVTRQSLVSLFSFFEIRLVFPATDSRDPFCLLTLVGDMRRVAVSEFVFDARSVEELAEPTKRFTLTPNDLILLNPNTRTCPVFRTARDAKLTKAIYQQVPVLLNEGPPEVNPWAIRLRAMFHMANDSGLFRVGADLELDGWQLKGNQYCKDDAKYLPLYEAKMTSIFDHRYGSIVGSEDVAELSGIPAQSTTLEEHQDPHFLVLPRYWVPEDAVKERLERVEWGQGFFIIFREIARATDIRTAMHAVLPKSGVSNKAPLILPFEASPGQQALLLANLNSFVFDYVVRQKLGGASFSFFIMKQLPAFPPSHYQQPCFWDRSKTLGEWIKPRVLEVTYTAHDLKPFAEDCGYPGDPFFWDDARRAVIRAELDAAFFHLYGISEADADYILDTFPIVRQKDEERFGTYRTKEMILRCYQEMQEAVADQTGQTVFASQLDPPPGVPMPKDLFGLPVVPSRRERLIQAFVETRAGWSSEYVVCSPDANARYLRQAETLVPGVTEEIANRELWNARRDGQLAHLPKSKTYTPDSKIRRYEFVVEWAYRHIIDQVREETGQRKATTLERILCIPEWRQRFDDLIGELMKKAEYQFSVLDYRWTAMTLRKRAGEKGQAPPSLFDNPIPATQAEARLPERPGVYLIRSNDDKVFTGWADNLKYQAHYLCETGGGSLVPSVLLAGRSPVKTIFYQEVDVGTPDGVLYDLWRGNRRADRLPLLNLFA
ncbi:Putative type II DNA modification enzyme OS=bacterium UASB14 GN=U14_03333 PE=4 SV=1 [Gemmata massiliana]|uniref:site-specific DNA-methyltransferase (adenine-specific) n=1 Tax=Gemmata massiliana TaxID=1210884 RepID=A0A6P2CT50_9BACT|nr:hypothetical protein [Gemmata massiliana]VTR91556.1 Putative type II DNA modification enzyme OS=bacterium UASB14 GN=U14_03333 PE=4 SV=1 [Gemmata massiliana]